MRLGFVSDNAYPWFNGGIEKRRYVILQKLAAAGEEVHCFTTFRKGMPGKEFSYRGVHYHCFDSAEGWQGMYTGSGKRRSITKPLSFSLHLFYHIMRYRLDLVDADSFPFLHILPLWVYKVLRRTRLVITWHEIWSKGFWTEYLQSAGVIGYWIETLCAKAADMHIANTTTTKRLLEDEFGIPAKKIKVLAVAVDEDEIKEFLEKSKVKRRNKFIVVNRLVKHKRVELAIEAMRDVNAQLVVVGTGPELGALEKVAAEYGRGKVAFMHDLRLRSLLRQICSSRALIMPSGREGLSLVTAEAMALGTPVVILKTSSIPRELRQFCIEASDSSLSATLNKILRSPATYERRYRGISKSIIARFSGAGAEDVYSKILHGA